jgi:hypothetical protein
MYARISAILDQTAPRRPPLHTNINTYTDVFPHRPNTQAAATGGGGGGGGCSIPTTLTPAVHTRLAQMKARHAEVEKELNELHSSSGSGSGSSSNSSGTPQRLAQLSKELAELGEAVDLAGQLEGKRSEVRCCGYVCVWRYIYSRTPVWLTPVMVDTRNG